MADPTIDNTSPRWCCYAGTPDEPVKCTTPPSRAIKEQGGDPYRVFDTCDAHLAAMTEGTARKDIHPDQAVYMVWMIGAT